ncbi:MBL fold metallo-hydrolase [Paenibacillus sp. S150]|uniref:MBL fold metallo-hydrolase n=1 Tax=Paenibacillus sp. S150 TaxID=2749826 RepID=UPI001C59F94C|nr:MBL fold metallo-hydrolase [Paenibacillus sp. S150]MBW4084788.1 MBL fold metallo-hydrolase [Paenibacillus sp. S150]
MLKWKRGEITLFRSELYETNSLVVESAGHVLVVDPCWLPGEVEEIRRYVSGVLGGRRLLLLFTHSDFDHIIGYGAFAEAEVIASKAFTDKSREERESILEEIRAFDDNYYLRRSYEITYPDVDHIMGQDGQTMVFGELQLTGYAAPGHTNDGLFTVVDSPRLFIAGDYLSDVEFPYIYDSSTAYEATLGKVERIIARHPVPLLVPGHGEAAESQPEIERRRGAGLDYIRRLRAAVAAGEAADHLIAGCAFPRNMRKFHRSNQERIKRELGGTGG